MTRTPSSRHFTTEHLWGLRDISPQSGYLSADEVYSLVALLPDCNGIIKADEGTLPNVWMPDRNFVPPTWKPGTLRPFTFTP